jgi:3-isopropylmalate/(R)-2-methylmalate dehydratase large subunit
MQAFAPGTLYDKIWQSHVVAGRGDACALLYIDRHMAHEVSTPQAFEGLRQADRNVRRPEASIGVPDHNVPTGDRSRGPRQPASAEQVRLLEKNCSDFAIEHIPLSDMRQGIVHVIGPEMGLTQPGMTIVCGDSHTSTHGAFGALAFGIGTTEVEHVLATQTLVVRKAKSMRITVDGELRPSVTAKDMALHIITEIGAGGGAGHVIEYAGTAVRALSMEGRMTLCNMSVEAGARAGLIAPDETTFAYLKGRPKAPGDKHWKAAVQHWAGLASDENAHFDVNITLKAADIAPLVTWGTSPEDAVPINGKVPNPADISDPGKRRAVERALEYMGLAPGTPINEIALDQIFIGSCTNSRIEDLRAASAVVEGRRIADNIKRAMVVPGSGQVKKQAEDEGLDRIFIAAGFEWRQPGCSMCVALNEDKVPPGERCASTSNRNFVGRQGPGARTHLVSPAMAAAAAIRGHFVDVRAWPEGD